VSESAAAADAPALEAQLQAARERGMDRLDRVRWTLVESLARRAAGQDADVRRLLQERLDRLLAEHLAEPGQGPVEPGTPQRGAIAALLDHLAEQTARREGHHASPAYFRRTWAKLGARQRLAQSLATLPENPGPLNSQHLVHRALTLMGELAPAYLERFVAHVDALLSLEAATAPSQRSGGRGRS
jgi:hypothetical protein